jgi:AcrR family transcriptional regulator
MTEQDHLKKSPPAKRQTDVAALDPSMQELVREMLVEGGTFEDVTEAVNQRPGAGITLAAVKHYFRSRLDVQQERVRRQVEVAQALKAAVGNPETAEGELAGALLMAGLQAVNRQGSLLSVKDVARTRLLNENLGLQQRLLRQRERESLRRQKLLERRLEFEIERTQVMRHKLRKVRKSVRPGDGGLRISDEAYRQIQEIYGLLDDQPNAPEIPEAAS